MKIIRLLAVAITMLTTTSALAADRSHPPPLGPVQPFALPVPTVHTLTNGLKVYVLQRHRAPLVDIVIHVGGGALTDPAGQEGAASAVAELLTQGAGTLDAFAFDDAVQSLGARIGAGVDWEGTGIAAHGLSARYDDILALLGDAVLAPRFAADDWKRKQQETLGELSYYRDEPRALGSFAAARALFPSGRQSIGIGGTPRSVAALTTAHIKASWVRSFRPDNAFVVVAGDLDAAHAVAGLEKIFGSWTVPTTTLKPTTSVEPAPLTGTRVVLIDRPGAAQSVVQVVAPIPETTSSLDAPAGVVQTILGGSFTSRLNGNLREARGYAYGANYAYDVSPAHRSRVSTNVKSAVTVAAIDEILIELKRICDPIPEDELARGRAYEALTFPGILDGGGSLANAWAGWLALNLHPDLVTSYMDRVLAVDVAAARRAATALIAPDKIIIVVVGDAKLLADGLKKFGPVTRMTANDLLPAPAP